MTTDPRPPRAGERPLSGPELFACYAYGPNRLGYCGPDDAAELFEQGTVGREDAALRSLARQFEGAYPYLQLIATANQLADPLDRRVVEAYWLGNSLLQQVTPGLMGRSLDTRFRRRLDIPTWRWLESKVPAGAWPVHAFHVLEVFPRTGLMRSGALDDVITVMDDCRIRWGRVLERDGDWLVVSAAPLELADGRVDLVRPRIERVRGWIDGAGFLSAVEPGDVLSIHWDWACERLSPRRLTNLMVSTRHQLDIANLTI
jgi:hypothetical protein